ncbi:hypothetical protein HGRIS_012693 [Hohenbuehelia grisea]|uniref:Uncharacterized protein n=1 Tax=Hohenbuehelia grisea TaxID=104357 RepID=A0ABR3IT36_9AGAR
MSQGMKLAFALAIVAAGLISGRTLANDWSKACFDGECAYDLISEEQSGTIKFVGAPNAIADITPAAGWVVLDCDANAAAQEIRLVCKSDNTEEAGCDHLFRGDGPEHKYVRLPEHCSSMPFARIAKHRVADNQDIPGHVQHKISRRDGIAPQVFVVNIDQDFSKVEESKYGKVIVAMAGIGFPGIETNFAIPEGIEKEEVAQNFVTSVSETIQLNVRAYQSEYYVTSPDGMLRPIKKKPTEELQQKNSTVIKWGRENPPFTQELKTKMDGCKSKSGNVNFHGEVTASLDSKIFGTIKFGAAAVADAKAGQFLAFMGFGGGFTANFEHTVKLEVGLVGEVKKPFTIMEPTAIPHAGLDLKQAGFMFGIEGEMALKAQAGFELSATVKYGVDNAEFTFPSSVKVVPKAPTSSFDIKLAGANKVTAEVSVTPKFLIGIEALFGNVAKANGFVGFEFKLEAKAAGGADKEETVQKVNAGSLGAARPGSPKKSTAKALPAAKAKAKAPVPAKATKKAPVKKSSPKWRRDLAIAQAEEAAEAEQAGVCAGLTFSFDAHVGAEASWFKIFKQDMKSSLWKYEQPIYRSKDCPADEKSSSWFKKREISSSLVEAASPISLSGFSCPISDQFKERKSVAKDSGVKASGSKWIDKLK